MSKENKEQREEQTFLLEVGRYQNKARGLDFPVYAGYIGRKQRKITVKFRRDTKDIPTETGYITVENKHMSIDNRHRYPVLWVHEVKSFSNEQDYEKQNETINTLFSDGDLPF